MELPPADPPRAAMPILAFFFAATWFVPASMFGDAVIRRLIRRGVYRAAPASSRRQQRGQFGRHAQHWVVAAVELGPFGAEPLGGASLVSLARVRSPATPDHARPPLLRPERIELDRLEAKGDRMRRPAFKGPGAHLGVEVGEQAVCDVLGAWPERDPVRDRCRVRQDVGDLYRRVPESTGPRRAPKRKQSTAEVSDRVCKMA